ncbi:Maf family protein [Olsenella massiliensis]|uniref:Maf family protein n=1 Tax=Olsenella massiliensis TaxID=1622075 RepID=UPI000A72401A
MTPRTDIPRIILASSSPRRRELLERLKLSFEQRPANVDERRRANEGPRDLVARLAHDKAAACAGMLGDERAHVVVIAADTTVWTDGGRVLGKPRDAEDARATLRALSGRVHHVSTGVELIWGERRRSFVETTDVRFHELSDAAVCAYVASGEPMDKAGSYGIQGHGGLLVSDIRGDYTNVVGLPLSRLVRELDELMGPQGAGASLLERALRG